MKKQKTKLGIVYAIIYVVIIIALVYTDITNALTELFTLYDFALILIVTFVALFVGGNFIAFWKSFVLLGDSSASKKQLQESIDAISFSIKAVLASGAFFSAAFFFLICNEDFDNTITRIVNYGGCGRTLVHSFFLVLLLLPLVYRLKKQMIRKEE
ncbi:MAG: hypothetical protein K6G01_05315 [Eubacterium sp.]|nr:hypothetical protein [Eubacterium sp.]